MKAENIDMTPRTETIQASVREDTDKRAYHLQTTQRCISVTHPAVN